MGVVDQLPSFSLQKNKEQKITTRKGKRKWEMKNQILEQPAFTD